MNTDFDDILKLLLRWQHLGVDDDGDGTRLIGRVPHVAPLARLHTTFAPLTNADIDSVEKDIGVSLPQSLIQFLKFSNGLNAFSCGISVFGLRGNMSREPDAALRQPFDIVTTNTWERSGFVGPTDVEIGFYKWDASEAAIMQDGTVFRYAARSDGAILGEWPNLRTWLSSELRYVAQFYDDKGRCTDDEDAIYAAKH